MLPFLFNIALRLSLLSSFFCRSYKYKCIWFVVSGFCVRPLNTCSTPRLSIDQQRKLSIVHRYIAKSNTKTLWNCKNSTSGLVVYFPRELYKFVVYLYHFAFLILIYRQFNISGVLDRFFIRLTLIDAIRCLPTSSNLNVTHRYSSSISSFCVEIHIQSFWL